MGEVRPTPREVRLRACEAGGKNGQDFAHRRHRRFITTSAPITLPGMSSLLSRAVRSGALPTSAAAASSSKLPSRPLSHRSFHTGPPAADPTVRLVFGSLKLSWTIPVRSILLSLGLESPQGGSTPQLALAGENLHMPFPQESQEKDDPLSWDGILNAVPKRRVTHSRKRMRAALKGLKDRVGESFVGSGVQDDK